MKECRYNLVIPDDVPGRKYPVLCNSYHSCSRPDGLEWGHFPACKEENCPLVHADLLKVKYYKHGVLCVDKAVIE